LVFSPDGKRVACAAQKGRKQLVVVDGQPGPEYDDVARPVFSPDGKRLAYAARDGKKNLVIVDGQSGPSYNRIDSLVFSPDGKRLAYVAQNANKKWLGVVDGQPGLEYDDIVENGPTFQPDGTLEYLAGRSDRLYRVRQ
jgi:Tol biopolymer transport system component